MSIFGFEKRVPKIQSFSGIGNAGGLSRLTKEKSEFPVTHVKYLRHVIRNKMTNFVGSKREVK
jgi:hypothetical protein